MPPGTVDVQVHFLVLPFQQPGVTWWQWRIDCLCQFPLVALLLSQVDLHLRGRQSNLLHKLQVRITAEAKSATSNTGDTSTAVSWA